MSDTFERMQDNQESSQQQGRAELMLEYMDTMTPEELEVVESSTRWLHVLGPRRLGTGTHKTGINGWGGKMQEFKFAIRSSVDQAKTELTDVIDKRHKEVTDVLGHLKSTLEELKYMQNHQSAK